MEDLNEKLKKLALKTMFRLSDEEMPAMLEEYGVFMHHVQALEAIDTSDVEPLCFPYEIETTYLREDEPTDVVDVKTVLANGPDVVEDQIRVPKVVG